MRDGGKSCYDTSYAWVDGDDEPLDLPEQEQLRLNTYIMRGGMR